MKINFRCIEVITWFINQLILKGIEMHLFKNLTPFINATIKLLGFTLSLQNFNDRFSKKYKIYTKKCTNLSLPKCKVQRFAFFERYYFLIIQGSCCYPLMNITTKKSDNQPLTIISVIWKHIKIIKGQFNLLRLTERIYISLMILYETKPHNIGEPNGYNTCHVHKRK